MDIRYIEIHLSLLTGANGCMYKFELDARSDSGGITLPDSSGVYEAKLIDTDERLTIAKHLICG